MKTPVTLVLVICVLHRSCTAPLAPSVPENGCCPGHSQKRIPKGHVRHVGMTKSHCETKAILITTVCEVTHCIDPDWEWAKNLLEQFKKSPSDPFNRNQCTRTETF